MSYYVTAAYVVSIVLIGIGLSKWSARRITNFDDTEVMHGPL
jgi:hypothetical protein